MQKLPCGLLVVASLLQPALARPAAARTRGERALPGPVVRNAHEVNDPSAWAAEPASPAEPIDRERFSAAVAELCHNRWLHPKLAEQIATVATESGVDPFVLAALAYRESRCMPDLAGGRGVGLLQIKPVMFEGDVEVPVSKSALDRDRLLDPVHNLRVGAALLSMWNREHEDLDARFPGAKHRTAVAHFGWGDRVQGSIGEDRILTARRRLIEYYERRPAGAHPSSIGLDLVSPLDGAPRLGTSGPGEDREGGARPHHGLDIDATIGEPVRAVADGVVQFAGADFPGRGDATVFTPRTGRRMGKAAAFGAGGLFVRIRHTDTLTTGYFHLASYSVRPGQEVKASDVIGLVGRTGVKQSPAHLHFEVLRDGDVVDPAPVLAAFVIPPEATVSHHAAVARKARRLEAEAHARRQARRQAKLPRQSTKVAVLSATAGY